MSGRQRGALSLVWVALCSALLAGAAMAALWSVRHQRNLFAEGVSALAGAAPLRQAVEAARAAAGERGGALRKCVIDGKPVVSNTDCLDANQTSKAIRIDATRGVEAPKVPPAPAAGAGSGPVLDKIIEKQLR